MPSLADPSMFDRWSSEVIGRLRPYGLADALMEPSGSLRLFLRKTFYRHLEDPRDAEIAPPLPWLPNLPLREWVELRLVPDVRLGPFDSPNMAGEIGVVRSSTISVERVIQESDPVIVLGEPGSGKSTLLAWAAQRMIVQPGMRSRVPLLVPMGRFSRWRREHKDRSIYHFLWESVLHLPASSADEFHHFMLSAEGESEEARFLFHVLLDGWDEVPPPERLDLLAWLERFEFTLPTTMTSRPVGYVSELPGWVRYGVAPLTFGSIWQILSKLATTSDRSWLADDIAEHLDKNPSLRAFARNPFVLTLLYAVAFTKRGFLPQSRSELYGEAVELMRQSCEHTYKDHGVRFRKEDLADSQDTAFGLLRRVNVTPYEFREEELQQQELFAKWDRARMITAVDDDENTYRFVHATLHESLAAIGLARQLGGGQITLSRNGVNAAWLETLRFMFGAFDSLPGDAQRALTKWIAELCKNSDRFCLILVHLAHLLQEAGLAHRSRELLGKDIRPELWTALLESPDPRPYASALALVGLDYALDELEKLPSLSHQQIARIAILYHLAPSDFHRSSLLHVSMSKRPGSGSDATGFIEMSDLEASLGYAPEEGPTIASAKATRTVSDIITAIAASEGTSRERLLVMELAKTGTEDAEEYLASQLLKETDSTRVRILAEALHEMGSVGARDALVRSLAKFSERPEDIETVLNALNGLFIDRSAETVLEYVKPNWPEEIRVKAARALGHCDRARILKHLAEYGRVSEESSSVRKATLIALAQAKGYGLMSRFESEPLYLRTDREELELAWSYLGSLARQIDATRDYGRHWPKIERLFVDELDRFEVPSVKLLREASALKGSDEIAIRLRSVVDAMSVEPPVRAAAVIGLSALDCGLSKDELLKGLAAASSNKSHAPLAVAYATVAADSQPEILIGVDNPFAKMALWEFSLEKNRLVFADRIQSTQEPFIRDPGAEDKGSAAARRTNKVVRKKSPEDAADALENVTRVCQWIQANLDCGGPGEPPCLPEESELVTAWLASRELNESPKTGYRVAAVFCGLHGMTFPIIKSEWGETSIPRIFGRGMACLRQWPKLLELIGIDHLNSDDAVRKAYWRACKEINVSREQDSPHSVVERHELPNTHRNPNANDG